MIITITQMHWNKATDRYRGYVDSDAEELTGDRHCLHQITVAHRTRPPEGGGLHRSRGGMRPHMASWSQRRTWRPCWWPNKASVPSSGTEALIVVVGVT